MGEPNKTPHQCHTRITSPASWHTLLRLLPHPAQPPLDVCDADISATLSNRLPKEAGSRSLLMIDDCVIGLPGDHVKEIVGDPNAGILPTVA